MLSPTWVHDSTLKGRLIDIDNYIVKKSFSDLFINNNKKRKFDELNNKVRKVTPNKKRKTYSDMESQDNESSTYFFY